MTILASDDFNRADNTDLGAAWDPNAGVGGPMAIVSNAAYHDVADDSSTETNNSVTWPDDQYSEITFGVVFGGASIFKGYGVSVRFNPTTADGYTAMGSGIGYSVVRFISGARVDLGSAVSPTFATGDKLRLAFQGSNWTLYKNGSSIASGTDGTFASGRAGIHYFGTQSSGSDTGIDAWEGGDFSSAQPSNRNSVFQTTFLTQ